MPLEDGAEVSGESEMGDVAAETVSADSES
jgi:hypothetical protein